MLILLKSSLKRNVPHDVKNNRSGKAKPKALATIEPSKAKGKAKSKSADGLKEKNNLQVRSVKKQRNQNQELKVRRKSRHTMLKQVTLLSERRKNKA